MRRVVSLVVGFLTVAIANTACLTIPGTTSQINLVSSTTVNGWKYDFYRNSAYPCSISGYQTLVWWDEDGIIPDGLLATCGSGCTEGESAASTRRELPQPDSIRDDGRNSAASRSKRHSPTPGYGPTFRPILPASACWPSPTATATSTAAQARPIPTIRTRTRTGHREPPTDCRPPRRPSPSPDPEPDVEVLLGRGEYRGSAKRTMSAGPNNSQGTHRQASSVTPSLRASSRKEPPHINRASVGTETSIPMQSRLSHNVWIPRSPTSTTKWTSSLQAVSSGSPLLAHLESCRYQHLWEHFRCSARYEMVPSAPWSTPTATISLWRRPSRRRDLTPPLRNLLPLCVQLPGTPGCSLHVVTTSPRGDQLRSRQSFELPCCNLDLVDLRLRRSVNLRIMG